MYVYNAVFQKMDEYTGYCFLCNIILLNLYQIFEKGNQSMPADCVNTPGLT